MGNGVLSGVRIIELAQGVAGPYCGRYLVALGADVIKVEPTGRGDMSRWLPPHVAGDSTPDGGALFAWLNACKKSIALSATDPADATLIQELCQSADAVIDDHPESVRASMGLDGNTLRELNPGLIHCSATWFGQGGPFEEFVGSDAVVTAMSGLAFGMGEADGPPTLPSGYEPQILGGVSAAIALLAALTGRLDDGHGEDIDLSILEATMVLTEIGAVARSYGSKAVPRRRGVNRFAPTYPLGVFECADGWIGITVLTPLQWREFCGLLELGDLVDDPEYATSLQRLEKADLLDERIREALKKRSARELVDEGQARRVPLAIVPTAEQILASPEFEHRGTLSRVTTAEGVEFMAPGLPFRFGQSALTGDGISPELDQHRDEVLRVLRQREPPELPHADKKELPLAGITVVDLSMGWSGPLAGRYFADLGADVIKVEACQYPDWWRGWEPSEEWLADKRYEKVPSFNSMNRNKLGITLDLTRPEGSELLKQLVAKAEVVIENNTATVLPKLGLDYQSLVEVNPDIIMISMPSYGVDSPWSHHRAYGSTVEQASGLPHLNGEAGWPPTHQHVALGDAVAGINATVALLAAVWHQKRTGEGQFIDFSQVESLLALGCHGIIEQSVNGVPWPRLGSKHPAQSPHGVYPTRDDDVWVAITVLTDEQWLRFAQLALGSSYAEDSSLEDVWNRKEYEDFLDQLIADWTSALSGEEAVERLQRQGIPSGVVMPSVHTAGNPQLRERGFFQLAPGVHLERCLYPLQPFTLAGSRAGVRWPAPKLGEHNDRVLKEKLGLGDPEITALSEASIIGDRPILS